MGDAETGEYDVDVVETDRSKTQRDHVKGIKQVIRELQEYDDEPGAPRSAVFDRIEEETDHPRSKIEDEVQRFREKGEIYTPDQGETQSRDWEWVRLV